MQNQVSFHFYAKWRKGFQVRPKTFTFSEKQLKTPDKVEKRNISQFHDLSTLYHVKITCFNRRYSFLVDFMRGDATSQPNFKFDDKMFSFSEKQLKTPDKVEKRTIQQFHALSTRNHVKSMCFDAKSGFLSFLCEMTQGISSSTKNFHFFWKTA